MLIDSHAHLYWDAYTKDLDQVLKRALKAGVFVVINSGVNVEKSLEALRQVQQELSVIPGFSAYSTIGIHPHEVSKYTFQMSSDRGIFEIDQLEKIYLSDPKHVVGVGECGLDFLFDPAFTPADFSYNQLKQAQKQLFQAQIDLAKKLDLPLVVHCRDDRSKDPQNSEAWDTVLKMVGMHPTILHCYSGLSHTTNYILQTTNLIVSFAANITYPKNEYLREAAKILPLDKIILETDAPFLSPQSKRGQRNEPANVKEVAQLIADIKGISFEMVAKQTTSNTKQIFNI